MKKLTSLLLAFFLVSSISAASMKKRVESYRSDYVENKQLCLETLDELACYFTIATAMQMVDKKATVMPGPASGGTIELSEVVGMDVLYQIGKDLKANQVAQAMLSESGFDVDDLLLALGNTSKKEIHNLLDAIESINPHLQNL